MKNKCKSLFKALSKCQMSVFRKTFPDYRLDERFLEYCYAEQEQSGKEYLSVYKYPKYAEDVVSIEEETEIQRQSAIIMQGPLEKEDNFTLNTVKIYKKLFPGVLVIVSTWENEDQEYISMLRNEANCKVVCSAPPKHSGILNLNYQITSTIAGIREAEIEGRQYVFKSRCDNRIYKRGVFEFLYSCIHEYPVYESVAYQKYRIVAGGEPRNSMFRPLWFTDQYGYGYIEDMKKYWNYTQLEVDITREEVWKEIMEKKMTWNERTEGNLAAEVCIMKDYFNRMEGRIPECCVKEYWKIVDRQFITVSRADVGLFWFKYDERHDESRRQGLYFSEDDDTKCLSYNWDFQLWLLVHNGSLEYKEKYELPANVTRYKREGIV